MLRQIYKPINVAGYLQINHNQQLLDIQVAVV